MTRKSSLFGTRSSPTEISDEEASDVSSETRVGHKADKKGRRAAAKSGDRGEKPLIVESDDDEDENEEIGEDELVYLRCCAEQLLINLFADLWLKLSQTILLMRMSVCFICP